jgi:propanediol dehydratase small subunit
MSTDGPTGEALDEDAGATIRAASGMPLAELTLEAIVSGKVQPGDIGISADTLLRQAQIAEEAGRVALGRNFKRASELVGVPEEVIIDTYELLRPGRVSDPQVLLERARILREDYGADRIADFLVEAVEVYRQRDLFRKRY